MKVARKVVRNTLFNFLSLAIGSLSGLFLSIILARVLKPENFGIYSLAIIIGSLCILLSTLGIDNAVVRYISFYHSKGDVNAIRSHFRYFLKIKTVITLIVSLAVVSSSRWLSEVFKNDNLTLPLILTGFLILSASFSNLFVSFFKGLQRFDFAFIRQIAYELSRWCFVLPLAFAFMASGAILGTAIAHSISAIVILYYILKNYRKFVFGDVFSVSKNVHSYIGFMTIASITGIIYVYVDSIMIGYLIDSTHVGFYRAAYTPVFAVAGFASSLAGVLLPTFTQLSQKEIEVGLERLNRYISIMVFPMAILLSFFAPQIVYVLYGNEYSVAGDVMAILAFAMIPAGFTYLTSILNAKERADLRAYVAFTGMVINIILNYILIVKMGIVGAAIATVISRFFVISAVIFILAKFLKINPRVEVIAKPFFASMLVFIILLILPKPNTLFTGIFEIVLALVFYVFILIITRCIGIEDFNYLRKIVGL